MDKKDIVNEDIETTYTSNEDILVDIANWLADKIGNCVVKGSTVFYINEFFEMYDEETDEEKEVDKGIFFIVDVTPKQINLYWPDYNTAILWQDIDNYSVEYFIERDGIHSYYNTISDFVNAIDYYMGRGWFGADEEIELYDEMFKSIGKDNINEDIEAEVEDADYIDIESLIEDEGIEAFSPENIEKLKSLGQIDKNGNLLDIFIEPDIEEVETKVWDLEKLHNLDYKLIEADYVKQLLINEVKRGLSNSEGLMRIDFKSDDLYIKDYSELRQDFVEKCFEGDVLGEFVYDYETDISYIDEDLLRSEKIDRLFSVNGLPEDSLILVKNGEVDEDENPRLAKYADELENAMRLACTDAEEAGAEEACLEDFNEAFNESVPDGCSWNQRLSDNEERCIDIDERFIIDNIKELWDAFDDYYSSDAADNAESMIKELINIGIGKNFSEPYSGWYGFSDDTFVDCLMDNLYEINFDEEEPQEEENLLNFNGNTGEYEEGLKEDIKDTSSQTVDATDLLSALEYKTSTDYRDSEGHIYQISSFWKVVVPEVFIDFINNYKIRGISQELFNMCVYDPEGFIERVSSVFGVSYYYGCGIYGSRYGLLASTNNRYNHSIEADNDKLGELATKLDEILLPTLPNDQEAYINEDIEAINDTSTLAIKKGKNIYYKYFEYNKELSAKSYRLTGEHILILAEWAKENDTALYEELDGSYYLDDRMESDAFIIMSKIKPSYSDIYNYKNGYTLWGDDMFYEPQYLGEIPKEVGDRLIKGKSLAEELAVCCVPADFPYDNILVDNNALETLLQRDVDNNAWGTVDSDTGELITDMDTFGAAWQLAKHTKGTILFVYLPNDDTDLDVEETEDKIQFVPIALLQNEK